MAARYQAQVTWDGDLSSGGGTVSAVSSGIFTNLPVSWKARTGPPDHHTSPEELLAAAHASCFAMALSHDLSQAGNPPQRLEVTAEVTFDRVEENWRVVSSALQVRGHVSGTDDASFQKAAEGAKDGCPISQALKGNVTLSVEASLA